VLLLCVGAANVLANPKRLLKAMPAALHEIGVAITVALTVAPQLIESGQRVHRARRLRGEDKRRFHVFREIAIPVMTDALDRSLLLAAAMDSRGYGRAASVPARTRLFTTALLLTGLLGICIGSYGLLDSTAPRGLGLPLLLGGAAVGWAGVVLSGRRVQRTAYRPDPWLAPEWAVAGVGVVVATVVVAVSSVNPDALFPSLQPLQWPTLPPVAALAILFGALPAWLAPPVERRTAHQTSVARPPRSLAEVPG
jgi:energy-coupling factor transport system permease protein